MERMEESEDEDDVWTACGIRGNGKIHLGLVLDTHVTE